MRNSFSSLLAAATIAFGLSVGGPTSANAESVMKACASQWKQAQTTGTTGGQSWPQFLAQCRTSQVSPASTPAAAPAPAPQSGSLFPWSQSSAPASATASNVGAGQSVMRLCASQWKDAKAAGTTGGQSWPQFLAQCRTRQGSAAAPSGGFAPASAPARPPRPPLSQALCSHGGSSRLPLLQRARPLLREQANTPPNSRRVRGARRTPSFGPTRRLASITTREPGISGTPATARICARLTRAPPAIALRGTASVRPRRLLGKDVGRPARQACRAFICLTC